MTHQYSVRQTVLGPGERLPILIDGATGLPHEVALLYVLYALRPRLRSWRTVDAALRAVALLLGHVADLGINLASRIATGRYLDQIELDRLSARLQAVERSPTVKVGCQSIQPASGHRQRSAGTLAIIVNAMARFLAWLVDFSGRGCWATLAERRDGERLAETFLERFRAIRPRGGSGEKRLSLTEEQRTLLLAATTLDAGSSFARRRTRHWIDWGMSEGHRTGEMLNLRLRDIDLHAGAYRIVRRPDCQDDPRRDQPLVKGVDRELEFTPWLRLETQAYIERDRAGCPGAAGHDFLFVSSEGDPLSRSAVTKTYRDLRVDHPGLGAGFCHHVLRHTWNEDFTEEARRLDYNAVETSRARAYAMGWRDEGSERNYRTRETRRLALGVSLGLQKRHMARRDGGK